MCNGADEEMTRGENRLVEFIRYNLSGKIYEQYSCEFDEIQYPLGQKTRVTMTDDKQYVGFWYTPQDKRARRSRLIKLFEYDLDEDTGRLRSDDLIITSIPKDQVIKVEAIIQSNPRWGTRATNKFEFIKPVKIDPNEFPFCLFPEEK